MMIVKMYFSNIFYTVYFYYVCYVCLRNDEIFQKSISIALFMTVKFQKMMMMIKTMINRSKKVQLKKLNKDDKTPIYKIPINNLNVSGSNFRMIVTLFGTIVTSDQLDDSSNYDIV